MCPIPIPQGTGFRSFERYVVNSSELASDMNLKLTREKDKGGY